MRDWITCYADARVAFPAGVRLITEDDIRTGGVTITAYRREFDPPLPAGVDPPAKPARAEVHYWQRVVPSDGGPADAGPRVHRERTVHLTYTVPLAAPPWIHQQAARRWERDAAKRARPVSTPETAERIVRDLAAIDPDVDSAAAWACGLCHVGVPRCLEDHEADCPWRRAVEWTTRP